MWILAALLALPCAVDAPAMPRPADAALPSSAPAPTVIEKRLRIAVMDLTVASSAERPGDDVPKRTARIVADNLVAELRKLQNVTVVSMEELRSLLTAEATRQEMGCSAEESCLAEITDALGADVIVIGGISTIADARVLSLRRIDDGAATASKQVDERLVIAGGEELLAALGPAVEKLFPEVPLRAGEVRGVPKEIARRLNPPPLPVWSTLTVGALGLSALAGGVAFGLVAASEAESLQAAIDASAATPLPSSSAVAREARVGELALTANVLYVSAAVVTAGALAMALVTDWSGSAE